MKIVLFTHANRIRCILKTYFTCNIGDYLLNKKFANCAVLKFTFKQPTTVRDKPGYAAPKNADEAIQENKHVQEKLSNVIIEVISAGGDGKKEGYAKVSKGYYTYKDPNSSDKESIPVDTVVYMVRHGEGMHNVAKAQGTKLLDFSLTDAKLSDEGINQALTAGNVLREDRDIKNGNVFCFVSDLQRTHTTAITALPAVEKFYVLPCLFELNGGCDNDWKNMIPTQENTSTRQPTAKIDWSFNPNPRRKDDSCSTANVFLLALKTAAQIQEQTGGNKISSKKMKHRTCKRRKRCVRTKRGGMFKFGKYNPFTWSWKKKNSNVEGHYDSVKKDDPCSEEVFKNYTKPQEYAMHKAECDKKTKKSWLPSFFSSKKSNDPISRPASNWYKEPDTSHPSLFEGGGRKLTKRRKRGKRNN